MIFPGFTGLKVGLPPFKIKYKKSEFWNIFSDKTLLKNGIIIPVADVEYKVT
jgi:hypothetical protein